MKIEAFSVYKNINSGKRLFPLNAYSKDLHRRLYFELVAKGANTAQLAAWRRFFNSVQKGQCWAANLHDDQVAFMVRQWSPVDFDEKEWAERQRLFEEEVASKLEAKQWSAGRVERERAVFAEALKKARLGLMCVPEPLKKSDRADLIAALHGRESRRAEEFSPKALAMASHIRERWPNRGEKDSGRAGEARSHFGPKKEP